MMYYINSLSARVAIRSKKWLKKTLSEIQERGFFSVAVDYDANCSFFALDEFTTLTDAKEELKSYAGIIWVDDISNELRIETYYIESYDPETGGTDDMGVCDGVYEIDV